VPRLIKSLTLAFEFWCNFDFVSYERHILAFVPLYLTSMKNSYILKQLIGTFIFFLVIFFSAGKINYGQGLIYVIIGLIMSVLSYTVLKPDSDLLTERAKPGDGSKKWDKILLGLSFLIIITMYTLAGLDSGRYHWSPGFHWILTSIGAFLTASGQLLFLLAQKQNRFFSSTVRIQADRGHTVCDTGLYKIVRHPAYLGSIIQSLGFPLLFGSLWSIIPVGLLIILHLTRTYLEDKTLKEELNGYLEYSFNTRYKIIPNVW
jgi:protein-S-isoprenylcysteine O-methyltransferase Ste14